MASNSPQLLIVALLSLALVLNGSAAARWSRAGVWKPIPDVNAPAVVEIAKFAVSEYDKQSKADLTFEKVVKGESQVVAGTNYRLTITTKSTGSGAGDYEAVVWDKPWEHNRQLTSFKKI